jgi:uncharacterized membrane protein YdbT with pleckstrin-like domain
MAEVVIRPTMKLIKAGYFVVVCLIVLAFLSHYRLESTQPLWFPALSLVLLLWPASRQIRRRLTRMTIAGDKLRYESGFLSKTTRTIQLSKIQDVRVDQTLGQRVLGVGDVAIETAGETSRLTIQNIDAPQQTADRIMEAARKGSVQNA